MTLVHRKKMSLMMMSRGTKDEWEVEMNPSDIDEG